MGQVLPLSFGHRYRVTRAALPDGGFAETVRPCPLIMELPQGTTVERLEAALRSVLASNGGLRVSFVNDGRTTGQVLGGWESLHVARTTGSLDTLEETVVTAARLPIPLDQSPLLRVGHHEGTNGDTFMWMILDHSLVDGYAIGLLAQALTNALDEPTAKPHELVLMAETADQEYASWIGWQAAAPWADDLRYWTDVCAKRDPYSAWNGVMSDPIGREPRRAEEQQLWLPQSKGWPGLLVEIRTLARAVTALAAVFELTDVPLFVALSNRAARPHRRLIANVATELPVWIRAAVTDVALEGACADALATLVARQSCPITELRQALDRDRRVATTAATISGGSAPSVLINMMRTTAELVSANGELRTRIKPDPLRGNDLGWVSGMVIDVEHGASGARWLVSYGPDNVTHRQVSSLLQAIGATAEVPGS